MAAADVKRTASIYINDADAQRALKRLQEEAKHLTKRLEEVPLGSKDFKDISNRLVQVQRNMKALQVEAKEQDGWFTKMKGSLGGLGSMLAGVFAFDAIKSGFKATLDAHREHEMAVAKVETALKNQGATAGVTFQQMAVDANRLQENSLFSDEDILSKASTSLLNFGNIAGDNFMRAQQTAVDLSTTMDGDLQGAAMAVGKALNNPVQGLTALQRMGVRFTEDQKEVIKTLVDTGKASEAQGIILGELEKRFAGQAKAQAEAEGGYHRLSVAIDELLEGVGGRLSGTMNMLSGMFANVVNGIGSFLGPAQSATDAFAEQNAKVKDLTANVSPLLGRYDDLSAKTNLSADEQGELRSIIDKVAKAVPLAVTEFDKYGKALGLNTDKAREFIENQKDLLKFTNAEAIKEVETQLKQLTAQQERYIGFLNTTNQTLVVNGETYQRTADGIVRLKEDSRGLFAETQKVTLSQEEAAKVLNAASTGLNDYTSKVNGARQSLAELNGEAIDNAAAQELSAKQTAEAADAQEKLRAVLDAARRQLEVDGKQGMERELAQVSDKYDALREQAAGNIDALSEIANMEGQAAYQVRQKWAEKQLDDLRKLDEQIRALRGEAAVRDAEDITVRRDAELQLELDKVAEKYAKLEEAAKGHSARRKELAELEEQEVQAVRQKHAEEAQAAREEVLAAEEEERLAGIERKLTAMDEEYALEVAKREEQELGFEDLRIAHEERRNELEAELLQAKKDIVDQHFEELYAQADAQGISTENLQRLHGEAILSIEQEAAREQVRLTREKNANILASEKARNAAVRDTAVGMLDALDAVFTATAADAKEAQDFHKALTIVKIGVDTASAISGIVAASAIGDPFTAAIRIASGVAVVLTNIAKATALLSKDAPEPPKFAEGGSTGRVLPSISQGGHIGKPMLGLFGEAGDEWVAPHKMYRHPVLAPVFHWLEDVRVSGRLPAYAEGGNTYDQVLPGAMGNTPQTWKKGSGVAGPESGGGNEPIGPMLGALATALSTLNGHLQNGIEARMNYDQQQQDNERMDTIKNSANRAR